MINLKTYAWCGWLMITTAAALNAQDRSHPDKPVVIRFVKHVLDKKFRSEGVAVGDFNRDGKLDIAAGYVWYESPNWKMHSVLAEAPEYQPKGTAMRL